MLINYYSLSSFFFFFNLFIFINKGFSSKLIRIPTTEWWLKFEMSIYI